jgi:hypothetical protein
VAKTAPFGYGSVTARWPLVCTWESMTSANLRHLLILLAVLLICSLGAFFLFVTILPAVVVTLFITMLCGTFRAGLYLGQNPEITIGERRTNYLPKWSFPKRTAQVRDEYRTAA